ncbi:hypothetical protein AAULR_26581, partial [Lacticaseibacillus rhamnosus MTCC 5462]
MASSSSQQSQKPANQTNGATLSDNDLEKLIDTSEATPTQNILKMKAGVPSNQQEAWLKVAKRVADQEQEKDHREQIILFNDAKIVIPASKANTADAASAVSNQASEA